MCPVNIDKSFDKAKLTRREPVSVTSNGKYSFGIVNSRHNGKRLTFSKALVEKLALDDTVFFFPLEEDNVLFVGKVLDLDGAYPGSLSGDENRKICYSGPIVADLTKSFGLDFSNRTSMAFSDVTFKEVDGVQIAAISIQNKP